MSIQFRLADGDDKVVAYEASKVLYKDLLKSDFDGTEEEAVDFLFEESGHQQFIVEDSWLVVYRFVKSGKIKLLAALEVYPKGVDQQTVIDFILQEAFRFSPEVH